ncbi:hypothetical protein C0991_000807 [Blastosporella zonata]|nr:hypothetical protein C0991_000807 [Blastosporella zonata]
MSHRQPYAYEFASSSSHGILKDKVTKLLVSESHNANSEPADVQSERTPLIGADGNVRGYVEEITPSPSASPGSTISQLSDKAKVVPVPVGAADVALRLENTGSVARDHLASERTFLAYVRTSLSIASAGVALAQILSISKFFAADDLPPSKYQRRVEAWARPLGASAILISLLVLVIGVGRYFTIQHALIRGRFPVARIGIGLLSMLFGALIIATFAIIMQVRVPVILSFR